MSTIAEYLESLRGKSVAVIGMGVSNTPLIRMMLRAGLKVTVCDKSPRERVEELAAELESLGAKFQLGEEYLDKLYRFDVIFRTPGLSPNHPELVKAAEKQREAGALPIPKYDYVVQMLEAKGIKVTAEVKAMIEAAVKELDIAVDSTIGTLGGIFVEDNPGKTDGQKELNN